MIGMNSLSIPGQYLTKHFSSITEAMQFIDSINKNPSINPDDVEVSVYIENTMSIANHFSISVIYGTLLQELQKDPNFLAKVEAIYLSGLWAPSVFNNATGNTIFQHHKVLGIASLLNMLVNVYKTRPSNSFRLEDTEKVVSHHPFQARLHGIMQRLPDGELNPLNTAWGFVTPGARINYTPHKGYKTMMVSNFTLGENIQVVHPQGEIVIGYPDTWIDTKKNYLPAGYQFSTKNLPQLMVYLP